VTEGKREHCRLVQTSEQAWVLLIFSIFVLGFIAAPEVVDAAGSDVKPWTAVLFLPAILYIVWQSWRMFRVGVRVCANEAKIVTMRKTIAVPWTEIDSFEVGASTLVAKIGIAHLRSGERIVIWGIQAPNPLLTRPKNPSVERQIEELNAELRQRTAGPAATPGRPHAARGAAG
jgi:hypothetical protein